jgi:hypothetical protein
MQHLYRDVVFQRTTTMAITASFSPRARLLLVFSDNADAAITISRNVAGQILVNGGAISIRGGQPTIANTAEIQAFSKGGEGKIIIDESNGALPATELFDSGGDNVLRGGKGNIRVVGCNDHLMWNHRDDAAETFSEVPCLLIVGTMILLIVLCELVFEAGWKQTSAGKCNQNLPIDCEAVMTNPKSASSSSVASALNSIPFVNARSWISTQLQPAKRPSLHSGSARRT